MAIQCQPGSLVAAAKCWDCVPHDARASVRAFLLCQIARVGLKAPIIGPAPGLLTNFNFVPSSAGQAIAVWDTPPAIATGTELWTSPDNITFSLATTIATPGGGATIAPPAVGSFMWGKARWINGAAKGPFSGVIEISGRVCDWAARVVANGGAPTTLNSRTAHNTLDLALVSAGISSSMITVCTFDPASLIAATTPLYKFGNDPWTNNGPFVLADLTINGLIGDGATKFLDSGAALTLAFANDTSAGCSAGVVAASGFSICGAGPNFSTCINLQNNNGGSSFFECWNATAGQFASVAAAIAPAFVSGSRTSGGAAGASLYTGNGNGAIVTQGTSSVASTGTRPASNFLTHVITGLIFNGNQRISFAALHLGLTLAQTQSLYNAFFAFRTSIGGGTV